MKKLFVLLLLVIPTLAQAAINHELVNDIESNLMKVETALNQSHPGQACHMNLTIQGLVGIHESWIIAGIDAHVIPELEFFFTKK